MKVDSTASSVAALSNAGVAVSSAMWVDVVGGDTLVLSFLLVLSHLICLLSQWHIKFLKPLVHSCSTICAVRRCGFPSLRVYLQRFEVSLETSSNLWCARGASSLRQLALKELLWYSVIIHLDNMTKPALTGRKRLGSLFLLPRCCFCWLWPPTLIRGGVRGSACRMCWLKGAFHLPELTGQTIPVIMRISLFIKTIQPDLSNPK